MTQKEKRDIFMHAVVESVPGVEVYNCLNRQTTGKDATYEGRKDYLLQVEAATTPTSSFKETVNTAMLTRGSAEAGAELEERAGQIKPAVSPAVYLDT